MPKKEALSNWIGRKLCNNSCFTSEPREEGNQQSVSMRLILPASLGSTPTVFMTSKNLKSVCWNICLNPSNPPLTICGSRI